MKTYEFSSQLTSTFNSSRRAIAKPSYTLGLWGQIWQRIVTAVVGSSEPQVWQESDPSGNTYWRAHDPINNRYFSGSEIEMRQWIEQRYYA